jgi:hypothetical protein
VGGKEKLGSSIVFKKTVAKCPTVKLNMWIQFPCFNTKQKVVGVTFLNGKLGPRYNILFSFFVYNFASFTCCVSSGEVYHLQ